MPYAWITSGWIVAVKSGEPVRARWHPMGLGLPNSSPGVPDRVRELFELAKGPVRVVTADHGPERVGVFYTALGTHLHSEDGLLTPIRAGFTQAPDLWRTTLGELKGVTEVALPESGLPVDLTGAADERALRLWGAFEVPATDDSCYEIKRVTTRAAPEPFGEPLSVLRKRNRS